MPTLPLSNGNLLDVYEKDLPTPLKWQDAVFQCEALGNGWRMPNREEIQELFNHRQQIHFGEYGYWAYWTVDEIDQQKAYVLHHDGAIDSTDKSGEFFVRPVR